MRSIMIGDVEYIVLRGDPEKVMSDPRFDSLAVMRISDDDAEISEVQWLADERRWWSYPDSTTTAPLAALREALARRPT